VLAEGTQGLVTQVPGSAGAEQIIKLAQSADESFHDFVRARKAMMADA
jgi:hypothetical protein